MPLHSFVVLFNFFVSVLKSICKPCFELIIITISLFLSCTTEFEMKEDRLLVPEALLAAAKDARYIGECRTLIQQLLETFGCSDENIATAASSILYSLLVFLPRGRTLGMEVTGLKLDRVHYRLVALSVASSFATYALSKIKAAQEEDSTESLRGASRRAVFLRQREVMVGRTQQTSMGETRENASNRGSAPQNRIKAFLRIICDAFSPGLEGPHFRPADSNIQLSWLQWLLRLHLAFYCMHGRYASWMHRLLGITYQQSEEARLVTQPTIYRAVGALILSHAVGTGLLSVSRRLVHWWFDFCSRFIIPNAPPTDIPLGIPSHVSGASSSSLICGICHGQRTYPACPVDCGHVFCWTCLQKWVQTVRPECPICRSHCSAKDVIPLYNYYPSE